MASGSKHQHVLTGHRRPGGLTLRPIDDTRYWDALVSDHPDVTPFHLSLFLTTAGRVLDLQVELMAVERDGEIIGTLPLLTRRIEPFVLANHRLPFPYVGPLLVPEISLDDVVAAVRQHVRPRPLVHFGAQAIRPFHPPASPGWECSEGSTTLVVPLGNKDDNRLLSMIGKSQRGTLKRADRAGVTAGTATREEVAEYLEVWVNLPFIRQGVSPRWPRGAHLAFYDALVPSGLCRAIAVRRDEELLAVSTDLLFGKRMIGWEIGISDSGRASGAASVLELAAMRLARALGAVELDLLAAVTPGQAAFKRSFGAESRPIGGARWASPLLHLGKRLRSLASPS